MFLLWFHFAVEWYFPSFVKGIKITISLLGKLVCV